MSEVVELSYVWERIRTILCGLYLSGTPHRFVLSKKRWLSVLNCLRVHANEIDEPGKVLRRAGFWEEAITLESRGVWDWAAGVVERGECLSACCEEYPLVWIDKLKWGAPPVLWKRGTMPRGKMLSLVGSREVDAGEEIFCIQLGEEAVRLGYSLVSGGARGCDSLGMRGFLESLAKRPRKKQAFGQGGVALLPFGLGLCSPSTECQLSLCAWNEPFSGARAMERNTLIYAASSHSIIAHARFGEGGTWHGAVAANRRKLSQLLVREWLTEDVLDPASRALIAIGGIALASPGDLEVALKTEKQYGLWNAV